MQIEIDNKNKIVIYWASKKEKAQIPIQDLLIIEQYRKQKYKVCIYHSGSEDMYTLTSALLKDNLKQLQNQTFENEIKSG